MASKSTFLTPHRPQDVEKGLEESSSAFLDGSTGQMSSSNKHESSSDNEKPQTARTGSVGTTIFLILLSGAVTAAVFIWFGISTAQQEQTTEFTRAAADATNKIASAFEDYVNAASTIHLRCRHRDFTRQDFQETYEYIIASGLDFKSAQFAPMITHPERADAEAEARAYYAENYPHVDYQGIRGFNYANSTSLEPRIEQPFYFPIHYQEPITGNEAAIDLDYHSSESRTRAVEALFETKGPSLTDRLSLVKKQGEVSRCGAHNGPSFGVVLMHPGVALPEPQATDDVWPKDFAAIVLCIPDLLDRSTAAQSESSLIYIHDRSHPTGDAVFLGGAHVEVDDQDKALHRVDFLDETPLEELSAKLVEQSNVTAANRVWTVTIMSTEGTYEPDILFVTLGGAIIFCASFFLSIWVYTRARRAEQYNQVVESAERSNAIVSSLFPKKVAQQIMDYEANDIKGGKQDLKSKPIADLFPETTVVRNLYLSCAGALLTFDYL